MNTESSGPQVLPAHTTREGGFLRLLRAAASIAVTAGAVISVGLVLYAGRRNDSRLLITFFALAVLSPFIALAFANMVAKRWSVAGRATLHAMILVLTLACLAIYGNATLKAKGAFVFIVVPPTAWLMIAVIFPVAALLSGRLRIFKAFGALVTLGIFAIAALWGALWMEHRNELTLPTPTGSFAVGRVIYDWRDDVNLDMRAPVHSTTREVLVWIWYPAEPDKSVRLSDYIPAELQAKSTARDLSFLGLLTRDPSKVRSHSIPNAEVSSRQHAYPVVIMRTGASAPVLNYTTLAEDLASHGYVVVGFDAPYRTGLVTFPDGRVIGRTPENNPELYSGEAFLREGNKLLTAWTADMRFVLDQLERVNTSHASGKFSQRLDLTRVGVFGHSFGGAQAAQFCSEDSRCIAGIDVDGAPIGNVIRTGIQKPFMFLLSDHEDSSDPESRQIKANIQSIYDRLPSDRRLRVEICGAFHFTFSDDGALLKSSSLRAILRVFGKLRMGGRRQLAVTAYCIHTFFDAYLKEKKLSQVNISSPLYPEIKVLQ